MALQNRVSPKGELHAVSSRGLFMGNKGRLHNHNKEIIRKQTTNGWVICALSHKGIKRELMSESYTELFFLDEATALSAGHRPCSDCLRDKFTDFKKRWVGVNNNNENTNITTMAEINKFNQKERYNRGEKVTFKENAQNLPSGTFIEIEQNFYLIWQGLKYLWSFDGYKAKSVIKSEEVTVLTPRSFVNVLSSGYIPEVHNSIEAVPI